MATDPPPPSPRLHRRTFLAAAAVAPFSMLRVGEPPTRQVRPAAFVTTGRIDTNSFALTLEGSGDWRLAEMARESLKIDGALVTIFAVGRWAAAHPDELRYLSRDGHEIANHTFSHLDLHRLDRRAVAEEITRCRDVLLAIVGHGGRWFQPSGIADPTSLIREEAANAGYNTIVGFDVDPHDDNSASADEVVRRTLDRLRAGSIVRLHLRQQSTVDALSAIIAQARRRGLEPVTLSKLLAA